MNRRRFVATMAGAGLGGGLVGSAAQSGRRGRGEEPPAAPSLPRNKLEQRILGVLERMRRENATYLSVPPDDGRWLRVLTETARAGHVVEVGTSTGYSGLWIALALVASGGRLTTLEVDEGRAKRAQQHFADAGVAGQVNVIIGDAHRTVRDVSAPIDVVFLDADKDGYSDYFAELSPRLRPGGLVLAHNVGMVHDYLTSIARDPAFETVYYMGGGGLAVTLKKHAIREGGPTPL